MGGKLGRVDEDAGDHVARLQPRLLDQPQVAVMQGAHGGHEGHRLARCVPAGHDATQVGGGRGAEQGRGS